MEVCCTIHSRAFKQDLLTKSIVCLVIRSDLCVYVTNLSMLTKKKKVQSTTCLFEMVPFYSLQIIQIIIKTQTNSPLKDKMGPYLKKIFVLPLSEFTVTPCILRNIVIKGDD